MSRVDLSGILVVISMNVMFSLLFKCDIFGHVPCNVFLKKKMLKINHCKND